MKTRDPGDTPIYTREEVKLALNYPDSNNDNWSIRKLAHTALTLHDQTDHLRSLMVQSVNERNDALACVDRLRNGWLPVPSGPLAINPPMEWMNTEPTGPRFEPMTAAEQAVMNR